MYTLVILLLHTLPEGLSKAVRQVVFTREPNPRDIARLSKYAGRPDSPFASLTSITMIALKVVMKFMSILA
ncbi:hypothetical protein C2E23DRAFT_842628 [Lenzites betulinus]|nr:hypothetical protein C2E23DRAFT_842628 [Lenzites betulinus]